MSQTIQFDPNHPRVVAAKPARDTASAPIASQQAREPHLRDYVKVLYKRRWLAGTAFLLILLGVTTYTFTVTPLYDGKTELLIEADNPNVVNFKEVIDEQQTKADYYQTQYKLLQSRTLARSVIDSLKLWDNAELGAAPARTSLTDRVAALFGRRSQELYVPPQVQGLDAQQTDETEAQARVIDGFLARLTVSPVRNSRLVDVTFRSRTPGVAESIANAVAAAYIEQSLAFKYMSTKEASDWLDQQLEAQRKLVEQSEVAMQAYREKNDAVSLVAGQDITVQKLADLNAAVTRAKTTRIEKDAIYRQLAAIQNDPAALDTFPAILSNGFIQQQKTDLAGLQRQFATMSEKLGDKHPEIIKIKSAIEMANAKLNAEIEKTVESVKNDYKAAQTQEESLVAALDQQKHEALSLGKKGIEYGVLQRDADSNQQIYNSLLQRAKETSVSGELRTSNVRVVDRAVWPRHPATPNRMLNEIAATFGGGIFALGLVFLFEYMDSRIKSPDEVRAYLGLPSLGLIPALSAKAVQGKEPLICNGVPPNYVEAFRTVRTNVLFSSAEEGCRSMIVTSTAPGEGKTTTAANLAIAFAQSGQRVLLIDGDMRRPRVHELFELPQEPGLSNLLVGNTKASESVRKTKVPGLWVLTAGRIPPNPAELLGSPRFRDFLASLQGHFDYVVVDTPPVMAVSDATVAAHATSGVVFVIGSEMTSRHAARAAVEQLANGRASFIGVALNRVELERDSYYYSQYYRREYGAYYQTAVNQ